MPSVPMDMPSLTVMVPNSKATPSASLTPSLAAWAKRSKWTLQGVTSLARLAMATKGLSMSSRVKPMAMSMARAGARCVSWVISRLRCFICKFFSGLLLAVVTGWPPGLRTWTPCWISLEDAQLYPRPYTGTMFGEGVGGGIRRCQGIRVLPISIHDASPLGCRGPPLLLRGLRRRGLLL